MLLSLSRGSDPISILVCFAVFYAAISLAQLVAGPLSDTHGRKPYIVVGLVAASVVKRMLLHAVSAIRMFDPHHYPKERCGSLGQARGRPRICSRVILVEICH